MPAPRNDPAREAAVSLLVRREALPRLQELCPEFQALGLRAARPMEHLGMVVGVASAASLEQLRRHPAVETAILDGPMKAY